MSTPVRPRMMLSGVVLGAPDAQALAAFYRDLLGWQVEQDEPGWVKIVSPEGGAGLSFQGESEYVPPVWPAGPADQQMQVHLDIAVADLAAAQAYAISVGAVLAANQPQDDVRVFLDPAGHPFCFWSPVAEQGPPSRFVDAAGGAMGGVYLRESVAQEAGTFRLERGFWYVDPVAGSFEAPAGMPTDLASIPAPLWGLIAPFGHQTRAAIIHDHGCDLANAKKASDAAGAYEDRRTIDYVFRNALEDSDVSKLRALLLWAGVSIGRYFGFRKVRGALLLAYLLIWWAAAAAALVGFSWLGEQPLLVRVGLLAAGVLVPLVVSRRDWNLVGFSLAAFLLILLILLIWFADQVVQLLIWGVSLAVRRFWGGAKPVVKPTLGLAGRR